MSHAAVALGISGLFMGQVSAWGASGVTTRPEALTSIEGIGRLYRGLGRLRKDKPSEGQQNLADMLTSRHSRVGVGDLFQGKDAVDDRLQTPGIEKRPDFAGERFTDL